MLSKVTRSGAALLMLLASIAATPAMAGAHGELVASSPTPGEEVGSVAHIDLVFSTPILDWTLSVDRPDGQPLEGAAVEKAASYLSYEVAPLVDEGQYIVRYSAVDTDGDLVEGAYAFTFEAGAPQPTELPVDLSVLISDEGWPWWNYALLFAGVVAIAVLAGLLAEKTRRLRVLQAAS
jgi:methionine-rich copper-binding protein CopC